MVCVGDLPIGAGLVCGGDEPVGVGLVCGGDEPVGAASVIGAGVGSSVITVIVGCKGECRRYSS